MCTLNIHKDNCTLWRIITWHITEVNQLKVGWFIYHIKYLKQEWNSAGNIQTVGKKQTNKQNKTKHQKYSCVMS